MVPRSVAKRAKKKPAKAPAKKQSKRAKPKAKPESDGGWRIFAPFRRARKWIVRGALGVLALILAVVFLFGFVAPPTTPYIVSEARRLGGIDRSWIAFEDVASVMPRSVVAAEDANFCSHWGFDMEAIREALEAGGQRGASTISQQVVKNVFLWQGRSWPRKAMEASLTPLVEALWSKQRILEVYLNVAEFDEGVFGVEAAAHHYFKTHPSKLTARQASLLAAVLPNPKGRSASNPSSWLSRRANSIADGAATIRADGRAECFEG
ncbi:monofunctional biosynthetic peptidoglycan transglycosylase [Halocynthiibacter halioticoli]|uniref:monofunctional biosynthetic peptidoglycan transglycosylase n=1 Tax=Halocynthiibacter TaxID=1579315 RepID=UPI0037441B07